jgi:hypothetical protein
MDQELSSPKRSFAKVVAMPAPAAISAAVVAEELLVGGAVFMMVVAGCDLCIII